MRPIGLETGISIISGFRLLFVDLVDGLVDSLRYIASVLAFNSFSRTKQLFLIKNRVAHRKKGKHHNMQINVFYVNVSVLYMFYLKTIIFNEF